MSDESTKVGLSINTSKLNNKLYEIEYAKEYKIISRSTVVHRRYDAKVTILVAEWGVKEQAYGY